MTGQVKISAQAANGRSAAPKEQKAMNERGVSRVGLRARAIGLPALCLLAGMAQAGELRVQGLVEPTAGGEFRFQLANTGQQRLEAVRFHLPAGYQVSCGGGAGSGGDVSLAGGQHVDCLATVPTGRQGGAFAVSARAADGSAQVRTVTTSLRGVSAPDQGFVVLIAGAIHDDVSGDGLLDAGEGIDYHYTVINAGNLDLAALQVQDLAGVVSCPQTTLAVDASMICTRSYTISAADAMAGEVINEIEVVGLDSLDRVVQGGDMVVRMNLQARAGIRVFKSPLLLDDPDGNGFPSVGDVLLYRFISKNDNAEALTAIDLVELDPTLIDGPIACPAASLGGSPYTGLGSGALASMDTVVCQASYTISAADGAAGQVLNLVEARGQATIAGSVAGTAASLVLLPLTEPALLLEKTVASPQVIAGQSVQFTITVRNVGNVPLANVRIVDPLPVGVEDFAWTCAGSIACPNAAGSGAIDETVPVMPIAAELIYTIEATIAADAPDPVVNLVTATPDGAVTCVPGGGLAPCQAQAQVGVQPPGQPRLEVSKSVTPLATRPGQTVVYTIRVRNAGDVDLADVQVVDPLPEGVASFTWTCAGAQCPNAAGEGEIDESIPLFPIGAELVYTVQARLTGTPPDQIVNIVAVSPDGIATCVPSGLAPPCQADAVVGILPPLHAVPVDRPWALLLLASLMLLGGAGASRRQAQARARVSRPR